ncbi:hypothetical protein [Halomonas sp.]|uniref:hypothetical protein n=1 Tax=Halomonas sp. TaxID=1486246 RepID=UPI003D0D7113
MTEHADEPCRVVYAFEWCDCIYESDFAVVELHETKRDAVRSMVVEANHRWWQNRNMNLMYGKLFTVTPLMHCAWRVREIPVHPHRAIAPVSTGAGCRHTTQAA